MGIFMNILSNDKLVEGASKAGNQIRNSLMGKQIDEAPDNKGFFFKSWQQEFWGAKTLDEADLMEFQYKAEAFRFMLEMVTDEDGYVWSKRRRVVIDYAHEMGMEFAIGIDPEGEHDFAGQFMSDKLNVLDMDGIAPYTFMLFYYGGNCGMSYTAEQRIKGDRKKVIYKMQLIDLRNTNLHMFTDDVKLVESDAGKERQKRAVQKRKALRTALNKARQERTSAR